MVNNRPRQDPQHLRDLKAGLDREGQARTWHEVAQECGISAAHARRVAPGYRQRRVQAVPVDPRTIIPQLGDLLTDEDVEVFNSEHRCLCGCGQETLQEVRTTGKVPIGAYRLFRGAHEKRMPWERGRQLNLTEEQKRRRVQALTKAQDSLVAAWIAGLIEEWKAKPRNTIRNLSRVSGVSEGHIRAIVSGRRKRIQKLTAAKLLRAMGEPLRPELNEIYHAWRASAASTTVVVS